MRTVAEKSRQSTRPHGRYMKYRTSGALDYRAPPILPDSPSALSIPAEAAP
jgi:hypothetical protein